MYLSGKNITIVDDYVAIYASRAPDNVAENILNLGTESESKVRRGRPEEIDPGRLFGAREYLVGLLEATWHEVRSNLRTLKFPSDVPCALVPWEQRKFHNYVVQTLLRPSDAPAGLKALREQRRQLRKINIATGDSQPSLEKSVDLFERVFRIPATQYTENQQDVICDKIRERATALARAGTEYLDLQERQRDMEQHMMDREASFARAELVRFCRSNRYRLTPMSVANALAGLTFISWRQSVKRCRQLKRTAVKGQTYEIFEIVTRIVNSNTRRSALVTHAEKFLRETRSNGWDGVAELRKTWYYFSRAIRTALDEKIPRGRLPDFIASEYWKRKNNPGPVDSAFDMEESIVL